MKVPSFKFWTDRRAGFSDVFRVTDEKMSIIIQWYYSQYLSVQQVKRKGELMLALMLAHPKDEVSFWGETEDKAPFFFHKRFLANMLTKFSSLGRKNPDLLLVSM